MSVYRLAVPTSTGQWTLGSMAVSIPFPVANRTLAYWALEFSLLFHHAPFTARSIHSAFSHVDMGNWVVIIREQFTTVSGEHVLSIPGNFSRSPFSYFSQIFVQSYFPVFFNYNT